jgi:hypothetical protein
MPNLYLLAWPLQAQAERLAQLDAELRRSKRREEKLAALQFRLKEDLRACGGDLRCAGHHL